MDSGPIKLHTIKSGWSIVYIEGSRVIMSEKKTYCDSVSEDRYSISCVKRPLKNRQSTDLNHKWQLNEGQKYFRMLPLEQSAILLTCIKR